MYLSGLSVAHAWQGTDQHHSQAFLLAYLEYRARGPKDVNPWKRLSWLFQGLADMAGSCCRAP